jgi:hypothetical protein
MAYMYSYDIKHRVQLFDTFSKYCLVDGLGKSRNNVENNRSRNLNSWYHDAVDIYSDCEFVLALENANTSGYVTGKLLLPLMAGSIPIYWVTRYIYI